MFAQRRGSTHAGGQGGGDSFIVLGVAVGEAGKTGFLLRRECQVRLDKRVASQVHWNLRWIERRRVGFDPCQRIARVRSRVEPDIASNSQAPSQVNDTLALLGLQSTYARSACIRNRSA